jgi:hypothetical protein
MNRWRYTDDDWQPLSRNGHRQSRSQPAARRGLQLDHRGRGPDGNMLCRCGAAAERLRGGEAAAASSNRLRTHIGSALPMTHR